MHIGISGRTFAVDEPGGAVQVGLHHTNRLGTTVEETTLFGPQTLSGRFPVDQTIGTGFISQSLPFGIVWEQLLLPTLGKQANIDLAFFPNSLCPLRSTEFDIVVMIHGVPEYYGYGSTSYLAFRKQILPRVVKRADHIITVSQFSKDEISRHLPIRSSQVSIVHNGIKETFLDNSVTGERIDLPEPYVLYVGARSRRKNFSGLLEAFGRFKQQYGTDHSLVIVGPSANATYDVLELSNVSTDRGAIHTAGYLTDAELKYAYRNADAFVFPSQYEGFGLPPLEAAAAGTSVVSSRTGAIPEILGERAVYVDPDDPKNISEGI
jgi:glycosyltransferase involved in cell wall biosynthesis